MDANKLTTEERQAMYYKLKKEHDRQRARFNKAKEEVDVIWHEMQAAYGELLDFINKYGQYDNV